MKQIAFIFLECNLFREHRWTLHNCNKSATLENNGSHESQWRKVRERLCSSSFCCLEQHFPFPPDNNVFRITIYRNYPSWRRSEHGKKWWTWAEKAQKEDKNSPSTEAALLQANQHPSRGFHIALWTSGGNERTLQWDQSIQGNNKAFSSPYSCKSLFHLMAGMPTIYCLEWATLQQKENKDMSWKQDTCIQVQFLGILNKEKKRQGPSVYACACISSKSNP